MHICREGMIRRYYVVLPEVFVTGHSLGGALATLDAYHLFLDSRSGNPSLR